MRAFIILAVIVSVVATASAQDITFGDGDKAKPSSPVTRAISTRDRDSIVVDAPGFDRAPGPGGEPNTRIFPQFFNGVFGGFFGSLKHKDACLNYCGVGNAHLSSQCCSLGFQQCCVVGGFPGAVGGIGGIGGIGGGLHGGFGGVKPGTCPGLFGFRSNDANGQRDGLLRSADNTPSSSRRRRDSAVRFGEPGVEASTNPEVNPRFFGLFDGLFGVKKCSTDFECPGQLKCCLEGFKRVCKQPSFFG